MRYQNYRRLFFATILLLLMLVFVACGGDDEHSGSEDNATESGGDQIAFVSTGDDGSNLVVTDGAGGEALVVTEGIYLASPDPLWAWSPDGKQIASISFEGDDPSLDVSDADGSNRRSVAEAFVQYVVWSPDSGKIAFSSTSADAPPLLNLVDADGENHHSIEVLGRVSEIAWSPDSQQIAYSNEFDVFVVEANGQNERNLTDSGAFVRLIAWSPDGEQISFHRGGDDGGLMVMDANGENVRAVVDDSIGGYLWSPDGSQIAYVNDSRQKGLYVVDVDGTNQRELLAQDYDRSNYSFVWLPNGEDIIFWGGFILGPSEPIWGLNRLNVDSGEHVELDLGDSFVPVGPFDLSPDGSQLLMVGSEGDTDGIYVVNVDGSDIQRLADGDRLLANPQWRPR